MIALPKSHEILSLFNQSPYLASVIFTCLPYTCTLFEIFVGDKTETPTDIYSIPQKGKGKLMKGRLYSADYIFSFDPLGSVNIFGMF